MAEKVSFEEQLEKLQTIVSQLEQGDVPLEKALTQFQDGVKLSKQLQDTLDNAEKTLTKLMDDNNQEINFDADTKEE
ncbi:exodeoxyribonuclease VII small subunit [Paucilactobacillus nenjiangensis]|uniref:exodeoxyribonuclease VII small subunit n=1 Tax=Paucilactobacillus nenjiangensis TaxID=1296540 RepID=UPI0028D15F53|nr:exodeoxyribonuclease VII small subunit [Paucilactobacillus nenjiangensis]